jgi:hypothetical protein
MGKGDLITFLRARGGFAWGILGHGGMSHSPNEFL